MSKVEERLAQFGVKIPDVPAPLAAYVPGITDGIKVYTSGQLPMENGTLKYKGHLGNDVSVETGYEAAKLCAINCLGVIKSLIGDLDRVEKVIKVVGFVNSTADFESQPKVINGASELFVAAFGSSIGSHARSAVGVAALPLGAACEVEIIVQYK